MFLTVEALVKQSPSCFFDGNVCFPREQSNEVICERGKAYIDGKIIKNGVLGAAPLGVRVAEAPVKNIETRSFDYAALRSG
jgi:hypothetical protein